MITNEEDRIRCAGCKSASYALPWIGSADLDVWCISDRPENGEQLGWSTEHDLKFLKLLLSLDVDTDKIRFGYVVQCPRWWNQRPEWKEIHNCAKGLLGPELDRLRPSTLILMGEAACSLFPRVELAIQHGRPLLVDEGESIVQSMSWSGWIVPMHHPATCWYKENIMDQAVDDWTRLKLWWETGEWMWPDDEVYESWLRMKLTGEYQVVDNVKYTASDMYFYMQMTSGERALFHQFKKKSQQIKWTNEASV